MRKAPPAASAVALAIVVLALLVGCSKSKDQAVVPNPNNGTLAPATNGDVCDDPKADLSNDTQTGAAASADPAGVDLVKAEAHLTDTTLQVKYTTAGPVDQAPDALFDLAQGVTGNESSFEIRAEQIGPGQPFGLTVITWKDKSEQRSQLPFTVTVKDNVVSYEIPLKSLPTVSTLLWQFGSSSTAQDGTTIFDECSSLNRETTTTQAGGTAPATSTPPTTQAPSPVGQEITGPNGMRVTVYEVQVPTTSKKTLAIPPDAGNQIVTVDAQICGGDRPLAGAGEGSFAVKTADNREYQFWNVPQTVNDPALPEARDLSAGECIRGWIPFQIPTDAQVSQVTFNPFPHGRANFLVWKVG